MERKRQMKNRQGQNWASALLTLLTVCSLSIVFPTPQLEKTRLLPLSATWALGLTALFLLYRHWTGRPRLLTKPSLWILGLVCAGVMTLAQSFAAAGTTELLTESLGRTLLFFAGRVPLYCAGFGLLREALTKAPALAASNEAAPAGLFSQLGEKNFLLVAGLLLLCWLPYWFFTFPGVVSNDSITQLTEIYGVKALSNGNPVFQTFLIWVCCQFGGWVSSSDAAVALYCGLQAMLMAFVLTASLQSMVQARAPRWLVLASFGFYALCPIFPLFAFCVGKDTNFAMAVLYFALMIWRLVGLAPGERLSKKDAAGLCVSAALVALLRNPGVYLAALTLSLTLLWTLVKNKEKKTGRPWLPPLCGLFTLILVWSGLHFAVLPGLKAEPMPETEEYSIPLQQVARVVASQPETLTESERAAIAGVMDFDRIKAEYNGELSDPIKFLWNGSASPDAKQAFFRTWLTLAPKHPATYFSATFHNTYGYLCPGYLSTIKPTLLIGKQGRTTALEGLFDFTVNPRSDALQEAMDGLMQHPLVRALVSPGLYGWLTLFALVTLLGCKDKRLLLPAFPALFTLLGCLSSAVNGYFRYAMPLYFSVPLLLALCAQGLSLGEAEQNLLKTKEAR